MSDVTKNKTALTATEEGQERIETANISPAIGSITKVTKKRGQILENPLDSDNFAGSKQFCGNSHKAPRCRYSQV